MQIGNTLRPAIKARLGLSVLALAVALAGCGGGGDGGGSSSIGTGTSSTPAPSPTPAPTPTPTPAPTGNVATFTDATVPGVLSGDTPMDIVATNRGLYISYTRANSNRSRVVKLHGRPDAQDAWTSVVLDAELFSMSPANRYSEADRAVTFFWSGNEGLNQRRPRWGRYTANAGGVSIETTEPGGFPPGGGAPLFTPPVIDGIYNATAGPITGLFGGRSWIVTTHRGDQWVRMDDGRYTNSNSVTDWFGVAALPKLASRFETENFRLMTISHPSNPNLYVGAGRSLWIYSDEQRVSTFEMPELADVGFRDAIWADNQLYFAYGANIYRLSANTISLFAPLPQVSASALKGSFCLQGSEIFMANGEAVNIGNQSRRSWIRSGSLSQVQIAASESLQARPC